MQFVHQHSIVKKIWGNSDTILFIFAGAAAEFALNKAVDWLYFTGNLPKDPLGRLFSTVAYARLIVFSEINDANKTIDKITYIHNAVENKRKATIPDWAYRDVLFMLIDYSVCSYELMQRKLTAGEKEEVFGVFKRVGERMHLKELPLNYNSWLIARKLHLKNDMQCSHYTLDLFKQYKKHLGWFRYFILKQSQQLVVPEEVNSLLGFGSINWFKPVITIYKLFRFLKLDWFLKNLILPHQYKAQIKELDSEEN